MKLNKTNLTINSRMYTVVSEESTEYMYKLGDHINEKIKLVLSGGKNIMGERPIVLAALNICDEYFKIADDTTGAAGKKIDELKKENKSLKTENNKLKNELDEVMSAQVTMAETEAIANSVATQKKLDEAQTQIKFLEGQIRKMEDKLEAVKKEYKTREDNLFNALEMKKANEKH